eukprot:gnl/TRDRNA2_/TRDRNA2_83413_c1_seq1.p1 gnl/TRDRNA2_/TRDRNA2_83413_c1~~gnl/TRDRNA2_/TRDRNA2_83413_c1_seq1.p1  ORF type:complete len:456 (-),score=123.61 gnl/TRDRNA2_/TRDRNA2_83413_c1_seq1:62-1396(-)
MTAAEPAPAPTSGEAEAANGAENGDAAAKAKADEAAAKAKAEEEAALAAATAGSFEKAHELVRQMHETLTELKKAKGSDDKEAFAKNQRNVQLQLLALRRTHRLMARAVDMGRAAEAQARRSADAEHAQLETHRYESGCCRAAARRCRAYPTPELSQLRPQLDGVVEIEDVEQEDVDADLAADANGGTLATRLEKERVERLRLAGELEALEKQKALELQAFRERQEHNEDLLEKLRKVEKALEPVCDLIELRPPAIGATPAVDPGKAMKLPLPLQLILTKFQALMSFGAEGGVSVAMEVGTPSAASASAAASESGEPPEKRAKTEAPDGSYVDVRIDLPGSKKQVAHLRFTNMHTSIVTVAVQGDAGDALLEYLWPEDSGRGPLAIHLAAAPLQGQISGRPYLWAQVLGGLRERAVTIAPGLADFGHVAAADVVQRLRARSAEK